MENLTVKQLKGLSLIRGILVENCEYTFIEACEVTHQIKNKMVAENELAADECDWIVQVLSKLKALNNKMEADRTSPLKFKNIADYDLAFIKEIHQMDDDLIRVYNLDNEDEGYFNNTIQDAMLLLEAANLGYDINIKDEKISIYLG